MAPTLFDAIKKFLEWGHGLNPPSHTILFSNPSIVLTTPPFMFKFIPHAHGAGRRAHLTMINSPLKTRRAVTSPPLLCDLNGHGQNHFPRAALQAGTRVIHGDSSGGLASVTFPSAKLQQAPPHLSETWACLPAGSSTGKKTKVWDRILQGGS